MKLHNYQRKIVKVEEGYDGGLYTIKEAKDRKQKYLDTINKVKSEINTLGSQYTNNFSPDNIEQLRHKLKHLKENNLERANFEERMDLVARLGIRVYPSEDLTSRRIKCGLDIRGTEKTGEQDGFAKVVYGRPCMSIGRTKTFSKTFALVY